MFNLIIFATAALMALLVSALGLCQIGRSPSLSFAIAYTVLTAVMAAPCVVCAGIYLSFIL